MNNYEKNITLERKFAETVKQILGRQFITQDKIMDTQQGTDFLIFNINPIKVGLRLRRYKYLKDYGYGEQFTIRYELASGNKTEYEKIMEGLVDYIMYGFVDEKEEKIIK
ncbi:MAG: hypothetical protein AABY22_19085, partial [Nanoarchaeota archaeon]